jgi:hypothetical protein
VPRHSHRFHYARAQQGSEITESHGTGAEAVLVKITSFFLFWSDKKLFLTGFKKRLNIIDSTAFSYPYHPI